MDSADYICVSFIVCYTKICIMNQFNSPFSSRLDARKKDAKLSRHKDRNGEVI